jgi:hypothetical protein
MTDHPFMPEYVKAAVVVLDFFLSFGIIKIRGESYEKTWLYP